MIVSNKREFLTEIKYVDLFCGIGGFRTAAINTFKKHSIRSQCVFSCDIDKNAQKSYHANFGDYPHGDIQEIDTYSIPDHDLLFAGFPCQPFSIIGNGKGFEDTRGSLFFEILRIIKIKKPKAFILENVKRLVGHNKGQTLKTILTELASLGYSVDFKILNALDFGLPQKRERVFIVGFTGYGLFEWPKGGAKLKPLRQIIQKNVHEKFSVSKQIREKRHKKHKSIYAPAIWHENKSGNISSYPYSCALRAAASHNYLLVNGERRLTPREMLRLQGFPDTFKIVCPDGQMKRQAGNAISVPVVEKLLENILPIISLPSKNGKKNPTQAKNCRKGSSPVSAK